MKSLWSVFLSVFRHDLLVLLRHPGELLTLFAFYAVTLALFPFALSADQGLLASVLPAAVWICVLLSMCLALDGLFINDHADGTLEQALLSSQPLFLIVLAKVTARWMCTVAPLMLMALFTGWPALPQTLLLGTPTLFLTGAVAVALTVGLRSGGVLLAVLVLPLYIPVLIFATSAVTEAAAGRSAAAEFRFLTGMLILSLCLAPSATAYALRIRSE